MPSESDPPFSHRIFLNAWRNIKLPRSQHELGLPISSPSSVTRMRSFTLSLPQSPYSDRLPLYANAFEMEKLDFPHRSPLKLLTKIVCLTFQALGYQAMLTSQDQPYILGAALVISFAASFSVMFIKHTSYPRLATIVEKIGLLFFALGYLAMTEVFFSGNLIMSFIIRGLALAWIMLALFIDLFI